MHYVGTRMKKKKDSCECLYCIDPHDDAEHTVFPSYSPTFALERQKVALELDDDISVGNLVSLMM